MSTSLIRPALAAHELVGAPWPSSSWVPKLLLTLKWATAETQLGNGITSAATAEEPEIIFKAEEGVNYTLIMLDPDAPSRAESATYSPINHGVVSGLQKSGEGIKKSQDWLVPYAGPSLKKTDHRYVFLLYQQKGLLAKTQSTIKGAELQDRIKWDFNAFQQENDLELVGVNFFVSDNPDVSE